MANPVQIILNPENYEEGRAAGGGGEHKDFFAYRDQDFALHRDMLIHQLDAASKTLSVQPTGAVGFAKVVLRPKAWAKIHRPMITLLSPDRVPVVGGADLGEMIIEVKPASLRQVAAEMEKAEDGTRTKINSQTFKEVPNPSRRRSEVGAIESIELYGPTDRRNFSVNEAVSWLSNPLTGSGYQVELFKNIPPRSDWDSLDTAHRQMIESFLKGFTALGFGVSVERLADVRANQPTLSVRVIHDTAGAVLLIFDSQSGERRRPLARFNSEIKQHVELLTFLDNHPLVRRISLPGIVLQSGQVSTNRRARPKNLSCPTHDSHRSYPKLGVIDGGISNALSDWVIDRWEVLDDADIDHKHGTFIGGLVVAGGALNGTEICPEQDGTELVDVAVFPATSTGAFATYYPGGLPEFFDEMSSAVADANARHGVRIFNMSLNITQPAAPEAYSQYAARLDRVAEDNDVIVFVSAGNTKPQDTRAEWAQDPTTALAGLALAQNDKLQIPAESARNVSVGALNPPDQDKNIAYAPARYSCRGPGLRAGVKPDLAHIGGSGTPDSILGSGLFSILPDGNITDGCGTSYAAPLVAKIAAALDHAIEGHVSRETLIGLLIHSAEIPEILQVKELSPVARHLVGFGMPPSASRILESDDHSITLVFASRIKKGQQINFRFPWPASLVRSGGNCRGRARLTLVSTPPLDPNFGAEFVRVNIDAMLQQEKEDGGWAGRLESLYVPPKRNMAATEAERIEHDLKWGPTKVYGKTFPRGVGSSSNWRLSVEYLERAGVKIPDEGVPFTAILTISDPKRDAPVFNEMRQNLQALGVTIADIRTAARITPRV
ncbi:S8 family peptidase [Gluconobacter japonicus]|uniref:S8 family peptidase n=1 Tax=Gluconobacter japonicus TaxID=376620 RepID=UPI003D286B12